MRLLKAKQISSNRWFQRVDSGDEKPLAVFATEVAAQFGVVEADVIVVIENGGSEARLTTVRQEMAAGLHERLGIIKAAVIRLPDPVGFEGMLKVLFGNVIRINSLLSKYPLFLWALRDRNYQLVQETIRAAQGAADISATEYAAIRGYVAEKAIPITLP